MYKVSGKIGSAIYNQLNKNVTQSYHLLSKYHQHSIKLSAANFSSSSSVKNSVNYDIIKSKCSDVEIPEESLTEFLFKKVPQFADRQAMVRNINN